MTNIYKLAARKQLRFQTKRGLVTTEDLYNLPIKQGEINLQTIAIAINKQLSALDTDIPDFLADSKTKESEERETLQLKLDIIKDVVKTRYEEHEAKVKDLKKSQEIAQIKEIIASKKQSAYENLSVEELEAKLEEISK